MKIFKYIRNQWGYLNTRLGGKPKLRIADRRILENVILPFFSTLSSIENILFVGCEWYTKHYECYFSTKKYYTLDYDPRKISYGSHLHIHDTIQNIKNYFSNNSLDLIICNGVMGWGLDDKKETANTISGFYDCLRRGGILMIGWNDVPQHRLFLPEETNLFERFSPYKLPPFNHWRYKTQTRNSHSYDFYYK